MIDIPIVLKSLSGAIGIAKTVAEAKTAWEQAELKMKMADVASALADAKSALAEAEDELRDRDKEIERLKASFARADETVEFQGKRYRKGPDGKPRGRAFCTVCWDDGKLFLLEHKEHAGRGLFRCVKCNADFGFVNAFQDED